MARNRAFIKLAAVSAAGMPPPTVITDSMANCAEPAKTITEVFAFELDRRLKAAAVPLVSVVTRPGVGVDAKTPQRAGIRDSTTPYQRNPYTPWAQGKDTAAWSSVRGLTDPDVRGGEYFAPKEGRRGEPVAVERFEHTANPANADQVWRQLEELAGVQLPVWTVV